MIDPPCLPSSYASVYISVNWGSLLRFRRAEQNVHHMYITFPSAICVCFEFRFPNICHIRVRRFSFRCKHQREIGLTAPIWAWRLNIFRYSYLIDDSGVVAPLWARRPGPFKGPGPRQGRVLGLWVVLASGPVFFACGPGPGPSPSTDPSAFLTFNKKKQVFAFSGRSAE